MKMNPLVGELSLYDVVGTPGVGADLSHIDTAPKVGSWLSVVQPRARDIGHNMR